MHYGKDGSSLDLMEWAKKCEDMEYKRVSETTLPNGTWISTVWLGLDHRFGGDGPPLIFETMTFPSTTNFDELDMERYSTIAEAKVGHEAMVAKWTEKKEGRDVDA